MKTSIIKILGFTCILMGALLGGYFLTARFLKDRQRLSNFDERATRRTRIQTNNSNGTTTHVYTAQELEEARKSGHLPRGLKNMNVPAANAAGDAAVQRSLRTLEEINRINEMNRRLMEQQQRQNR